MKDETLRDAFKNWEDISSTQEQVLAYETRLKRVLDEEAAHREAILREKEAKQEGKREEKETIARQLLEKGMDIETIAEVTGLERERVIEIQKKS